MTERAGSLCQEGPAAVDALSPGWLTAASWWESLPVRLPGYREGSRLCAVSGPDIRLPVPGNTGICPMWSSSSSLHSGPQAAQPL